MKCKCYIQNGFNKRIRMASNYKQAAVSFLKELIKPNAEGDEIAEFAPLTIVSPCGFLDDLERMNMTEEFDNVVMFRTSKIFDAMKRKDIGDFIRRKEKTLPKDKRELVEML